MLADRCGNPHVRRLLDAVRRSLDGPAGDADG
jgi:hypothetical protein